MRHREQQHLEPAEQLEVRAGETLLLINADTDTWEGLWEVVSVETRDGWVPRVLVRPAVAIG